MDQHNHIKTLGLSDLIKTVLLHTFHIEQAVAAAFVIWRVESNHNTHTKLTAVFKRVSGAEGHFRAVTTSAAGVGFTTCHHHQCCRCRPRRSASNVYSSRNIIANMKS